MNSPALEDEDDLILPLQNCSIKGTKKPDEFEETSPISNDNGTPLLSTPPSSVVPDSVSRKVQASPLALTTPARKVARDRFIAGLQAGSLHGYDRNYKQGPYAPSDSESPVPSLPPTPTKSNSHKDSLAVSADHITTRITFDADGVTRDDLHSKPAEQIPDKHRATIETMRREWAVAAQLEELQQQIVRRRALRRPKIVAFPGGNVKGGSAEEEARFLKEKVTKGKIHIINCLNCEIKGLSCPIRTPTPGFPMSNRYPHCLRCERAGQSHSCLTRRTATDEEKKAGDWQVKLLRTRHDDDERWTGKLRHMDELLTAHSSKLDAQYFAPLNPTLLPQSNRKWLDQQLLAGYGLRPAFDEPMKRLGDEEADSANLAPWMMPGEQGHAK
ncbi:uncharacterized protein J3D65DRAFT_633084 [Phyllosticta citribraziliensis]|uniref:Uncharacterized protein n=1 Tax=Phyllosticta citribraziliensis TaxID=989973 RepID=A0ABR1LGH5_9PEZI